MYPTDDDDVEEQLQRRRALIAAFIPVLVQAAGEIIEAYRGFIIKLVQQQDRKRLVDGRSFAKRKKKRTKYDHPRVINAIEDDYLGINPRFRDAQFDRAFGVSRSRYEVIRADIGREGKAFFTRSMDGLGQPVASMDARILLALKTLRYGVACHCFSDYFQMSQQLCRDCLIQFSGSIKSIYQKTYLRTPNETDVKRIVNLHCGVHGVPGMLGSLDCSQTHWKNCPKQHHGSYVGKEKKPCIVLESVCDYNLYIWYASYGYCGALNDVNILYLSPLLENLLNGSFDEMEKAVVPYKLDKEEFHKCYLLTDGIYPRFSRFVKAKKHPIHPAEQRFTAWQESARKDIERAFGVLKGKWAFVGMPIRLRDLDQISERMAACLILHNICVSDRVMGSPEKDYNPEASLSVNARFSSAIHTDLIVTPMDIVQNQSRVPASERSVDGASNFEQALDWLSARKKAWKSLDDQMEAFRLVEGLKKHLVSTATDREALEQEE